MLKIISINIEGDNHSEEVKHFLLKENADVVCLQEIFEHEVLAYEKILGMKSLFMPMMYHHSHGNKWEGKKVLGIAIFTKHEASFFYKYIFGDNKNIPSFESKYSLFERNTTNIVLVWAEILDENGVRYRISATHFTLTPLGKSTQYQLEDVENLISILNKSLGDFVLVGDLNAPRGGETFSRLASKYRDNIPLEYDTSIDPKLHRVKDLKRMVDGLFSTSEYLLTEVKFVEGISDHKALVANLQKIK